MTRSITQAIRKDTQPFDSMSSPSLLDEPPLIRSKRLPGSSKDGMTRWIGQPERFGAADCDYPAGEPAAAMDYEKDGELPLAV